METFHLNTPGNTFAKNGCQIHITQSKVNLDGLSPLLACLCSEGNPKTLVDIKGIGMQVFASECLWFPVICLVQ